MNKMKWSTYYYLIKTDLYRYTGRVSLSVFLIHMLRNPGYKYTFWMRTCFFLRDHIFLRYTFFIFAWMILEHYQYKYGISIAYHADIGSGFYIGHFGGIVIHPKAVIGKNCNVSHGVTIGQTNRGRKAGCPIIGDNVYIGPGAKIIGNVTIGNNAAIGANCVVTRDIEDYAVVVGIPGKVISNQGSEGYINNIDYNVAP
jgi:serine O-acetyltransferase